jgi:hypothetical protein
MIILIMGQSGSGKTRACKNFGSNAMMLQGIPKRLPFKKTEMAVLPTTTLESLEEGIKKALNSVTRDIFVLDDFQHLMLKKLIFDSKKDKFGAYLALAESALDLFALAEKSEKRFYFLMHEEVFEGGAVVPLTAGKLLKEKFALEGSFTIVIRCVKEMGGHFFSTRDEVSVAKAPEDMFPSNRIDNDLRIVDEAICGFYGLNGVKAASKQPASKTPEKEFEPEINT